MFWNAAANPQMYRKHDSYYHAVPLCFRWVQRVGDRGQEIVISVSPLARRIGQLVQVPISTTAAGCWPGFGCHRAAVPMGFQVHGSCLVYAVLGK